MAAEILPKHPPLSQQPPVAHWTRQRITALALLPLTVWLLIFLSKALHGAYADTLAWLVAPYNSIALLLWTAACLYHAALGIQVVLEDYVSESAGRQGFIRLSNLFFLILGAAVVLALIFVHLA